MFEAGDMRELGLVSEQVPKGSAAGRANALAHDMVRRFGGHARLRKQAIWGLSGMPLPAAMQLARSPR
jgi:enoyl-CoA hydratase/carnithine racemase